ncbi:TetR/AcrR family transcriptional regulator [Actinoplanes sp. URMC 104]|uniref:TetR/AcrR family transcriptional regulator n=1 Tax=Actinoplanes sp. URMC 104 TaxID=3423409 RepID=UPI003F1D5140
MSTTSPGRPRDPGVDRRVLRAALDLFGDAGWAGFAMEAVAKRAAVGKASLYLRYRDKETLLTDALTANLPHVADVDTGTLHGDLVELARQILDVYAGPAGRAAMRLLLEGRAIPGIAGQYETTRRAQMRAARAIVRRGMDRGELPPATSVRLLLETLAGGAMMHALTTAPARSDQAHRLVDFLLNTVVNHPRQGHPGGHDNVDE